MINLPGMDDAKVLEVDDYSSFKIPPCLSHFRTEPKMGTGLILIYLFCQYFLLITRIFKGNIK